MFRAEGGEGVMTYRTDPPSPAPSPTAPAMPPIADMLTIPSTLPVIVKREADGTETLTPAMFLDEHGIAMVFNRIAWQRMCAGKFDRDPSPDGGV